MAPRRGRVHLIARMDEPVCTDACPSARVDEPVRTDRPTCSSVPIKSPFTFISFVLSHLRLWLELWVLLCNAHFDLQGEKESQAF
jgi:hypothetical protein